MANNPNYIELANIESTEGKKERISIIYADIAAIDDALKSNDESLMKKTHIMIDGKYSNCIPNIGRSMYGYDEQLGFDYGSIGYEALKNNLSLMKAKLTGLILNFPISASSATPANNVSVRITNEININIAFEQAKQKIEDTPGLTGYEKQEIQSKIDDLESISKEQLSKNKKWEKVKPILLFALDKGADVAITVMSLVLQMKLGI